MTPLSSAYWCENCQAIGDSSTACPGCASSLSLYPLARWIKKEEPALAQPTQDTQTALIARDPF